MQQQIVCKHNQASIYYWVASSPLPTETTPVRRRESCLEELSRRSLKQLADESLHRRHKQRRPRNNKLKRRPAMCVAHASRGRRTVVLRVLPEMVPSLLCWSFSELLQHSIYKPCSVCLLGVLSGASSSRSQSAPSGDSCP